MMNIKDYTKGVEKVRAFKWNGSIFEEAQEWLGSNVELDGEELLLRYKAGDTAVKKGEYVVRPKGNHDPFVLGTKDFEKDYKEKM